MIENAFYFTVVALFLEIFKFLFWPLDHVGKWFDKKAKVNLKIYDDTNLKTSHCKAHIARFLKKKRQSDNKFGQLIEYNMRYNMRYLAKNVAGKLVPNFFLKYKNWAYIWINSLKFHSFLLLYIQVEVYQNILKLRCSPLVFTFCKAL